MLEYIKTHNGYLSGMRDAASLNIDITRGNTMKKEQIKNKAVKIKKTGLNALVNLVFSRIMLIVILMLIQIFIP